LLGIHLLVSFRSRQPLISPAVSRQPVVTVFVTYQLSSHHRSVGQLQHLRHTPSGGYGKRHDRRQYQQKDTDKLFHYLIISIDHFCCKDTTSPEDLFLFFHNTTDAIKMKSNSSNALYMGIVEDLNIFRFEMVLLRDLDFQLRLAL
jgi:hypothetical protein